MEAAKEIISQETISEEQIKKKKPDPLPLTDRLTVTPDEFTLLTGFGRDRIDSWLMDDTFPAWRDSDKSGSTTLIHVEEASGWLARRAKMRLNMPQALKYFRKK